MADSRENVEWALAELGWEVRTDDSGAVMGGFGKYHLMVSFQNGESMSVTTSYVGKGGEILSRAWPGLERLPSPQKVVRALS